jgi:hypothetical protein
VDVVNYVRQVTDREPERTVLREVSPRHLLLLRATHPSRRT